MRSTIKSWCPKLSIEGRKILELLIRQDIAKGNRFGIFKMRSQLLGNP